MFPICKSCRHKNDIKFCSDCIGNPKLVDNYIPNELIPLQQIVEKSGYKFGTNLNKQGTKIKHKKRQW